MTLEPAIEVRDEQGQLLGFANESDIPPRNKAPALDWLEPVSDSDSALVSSNKAKPGKLFEYVHLKWERYRAGQCIYWCVMAPRAYWPKLLQSSKRYRETELDCYPFTMQPTWAEIDNITLCHLRGQFLIDVLIRRAA